MGKGFAPIPIVAATTPAHIAAARELFAEYAGWLGIDLTFQKFEAELAGLPGAYTPPTGALLLAFAHRPDENARSASASDSAGEPAVLGCVALRPLGPSAEATCEMKRLYVRPAARGMGLGRLLVEAVLREAQRLNYRRMRLDTLRSLTAAMKLYAALGFREIPAYYSNPLPGVAYFEKAW